VVLLLGAVLSLRTALLRLGRRHPLQPLHRIPGAAILARTEAAQGPAAHARSRGTRKRGCSAAELRVDSSADPTMLQEQGPGSSTPASSPTLLDALLQNLYDFGDTEGETEQKKIIKKKENKKRDVEAAVALAAEPSPLPGSLIRGQRKRASSFFEELREERHCAPAGTPTGPEILAAAVPPSSLKNNREQVDVVEFHSRNKKGKLMPDHNKSTKANPSVLERHVDIQEFNLEKARLEVHRFGITGYGKGKERILEQERAIMLGAKPPKKSYVNYKVLQEQIKEKKAAKEEEKRLAQETDIFKKKKRKGQEDRKSKKKKSAPSILSNGRIGQVGKFKNGTLILSPVDIKKINSSRVAK
ncbi:uncharacterized protein C1orf131 homolog, partial [Pongo abelii]|uniref:uncharacterized protein C1orf131 homolog n=2 Tax=Pongo TaxID=9599 RepID=UPI003005DB0B